MKKFEAMNVGNGFNELIEDEFLMVFIENVASLVNMDLPNDS